MTKNYLTIFFDWGGVVADDPGDEFLALLLESIGASEKQVEEIYQTYLGDFMRGKMSEIEFWTELKSRYGFSISDSISDEFVKRNGLVANKEILSLVEDLKASGIKTAILSNVIQPTCNVLKKAGYYDLFDEAIASCEVGFAKPGYEIYQLALDRLNATPEQSIFIDDKQSNLEPADKMGFTTILAQNPEQIIRDIRKYVYE